MAKTKARKDRCPRRYHAAHEASHGVVGIANRLMPKQMTVGRDPLGTEGGVEFPLHALSRDPQRYLLIAVAGCVGTQLVGYKNQLVSEQLARLGDREPSWKSDAFFVWEGDYPLSEVRAAEHKARQILQRRLVLLHLLADALHDKGSLTRVEIAVMVRQASRAE